MESINIEFDEASKSREAAAAARAARAARELRQLESDRISDRDEERYGVKPPKPKPREVLMTPCGLEPLEVIRMQKICLFAYYLLLIVASSFFFYWLVTPSEEHCPKRISRTPSNRTSNLTSNGTPEMNDSDSCHIHWILLSIYGFGWFFPHFIFFLLWFPNCKGGIWPMLRKQKYDPNYGYELECCCCSKGMTVGQRQRMIDDNLFVRRFKPAKQRNVVTTQNN